MSNLHINENTEIGNNNITLKQLLDNDNNINDYNNVVRKILSYIPMDTILLYYGGHSITKSWSIVNSFYTVNMKKWLHIDGYKRVLVCKSNESDNGSNLTNSEPCVIIKINDDLIFNFSQTWGATDSRGHHGKCATNCIDIENGFNAEVNWTDVSVRLSNATNANAGIIRQLYLELYLVPDDYNLIDWYRIFIR